MSASCAIGLLTVVRLVVLGRKNRNAPQRMTVERETGYCQTLAVDRRFVNGFRCYNHKSIFFVRPSHCKWRSIAGRII